MAVSYVQSANYIEQASSPQIRYSPEGARFVTRVFRGKKADLQAQLDRYFVGESDPDWEDAKLDQATGSSGSGYATITLNYSGGLTDFVEFRSSPTITENDDGLFTVTRRYIGPAANLQSFLTGFQKGEIHPDFTGSKLQRVSGRATSFALAEAEAIYEGTLDETNAPDPTNEFQRTIIRNRREASLTFEYFCGQQVTGYYIREEMTIHYADATAPTRSQFAGLLAASTDAGYFYAFDDPAFDPSQYDLTNIKRKKVEVDFHTEEVVGADLVRVSETHAWEIVANVNEYTPPTE